MNGISIGVITYKMSPQKYSQMKYFEKLTEVAHQHKVRFFAFSVDDLDLKRKQIHGLFYSPVKKKWERRWTPFPTIVYDHVRYHPTEQFKRYVQLRNSGLIPFSYKGYSHKLGVMEYLSSFQDLKPFIPETEKVEDFEGIIHFIKGGPALLKPVNGTGGRDIYLLEEKNGKFLLSGKTSGNEWVTNKAVSLPMLKEVLLPILTKEKYMIQRKIPIQFQGRTCDTRVLIQKNQVGEWSLTGMGTRIGRSNRIVSNLAKGAHAVRTDEFIRTFVGKEPDPILQEIEEVSLKIGKRLDQKYGNFVEFGLDIGITPEGRFQLIEANSKPDRKIFLKTNQLENFKEAIRKPLEYHIYLCKQILSNSYTLKRAGGTNR